MRGSCKNLPGDVGRGTGQSQGHELEGGQEHQEKRRLGAEGADPSRGDKVGTLQGLEE